MDENKGENTHEIGAKMVLERRYAIYDDAAGTLADIEDSAGRKSRPDVSQDVDRLYEQLRLSMAFLSREVKDRLDILRREVMDAERLADEDYSRIVSRVRHLHAALARLLSSSEMEPIEEILALDEKSVPAGPVQLKVYKDDQDDDDVQIAAEVGITAPPEPEPEFEAEVDEQVNVASPEMLVEERTPLDDALEMDDDPGARALEDKAAGYIRAKKFKKAVKAYGKLLDMYPDRASYHNDIGLAYRLSGANMSAVQHYRQAVNLHDEHPEQRTREYYNVFFNLGMALKSRAFELFAERKVQQAIDAYQEAVGAFIRYMDVSPDEIHRKSAQRQVELIGRDMDSLEKINRIVTGGERQIDFNRVRDKLRKSRKKETSESGGEEEGAVTEEEAMTESIREILVEEETGD